MAGMSVARVLALSLVLAAGASCAPGYETRGAGELTALRAAQVSPEPLHHEIKGSGDPILFLHGFGTNTYTWRHLVERLARDRTVVLVDLKGFGRSPKPMDDHYALADQARLVRDFIRENDLRNLTLVGHSMGGGIALLVALDLLEDDDEYLESLVLIGSIAHPQTLPWFIQLLRTPVLRDLALSIVPAETQVRMILNLAYHDAGRITDDTVKAYAAALKTGGGRHALLRTAERLIPPDLEDLIPRYRTIDVPTLLIWGRDDKIVPLDVGERLHRDIPNSRLVVLDETGHFPHEERPEETLMILSDFLGMAAERGGQIS
jgi:pimeloyl-ACP methyl ester carboxylesterase